MADRYAYIPLIGIFVMAVWGAGQYVERRRVSLGAQITSAAAVLVVLTVLTSRQIGYWRTSYDLWSHTVNVTNENGVGEEFLGAALMASGQSVDALPHLQKAARLRHMILSTRVRLAAALVRTGHSEQAIAEYESVIPLVSDPHMANMLREALGKLYSERADYANARKNSYYERGTGQHQLTARDTLIKVATPIDVCEASGEIR